MKKRMFFAIIILGFLSSVASGHHPNSTSQAHLDDEVTAQDLRIEEPKILPTNPLYFIKSLSRGARVLIERNPIKKAKLLLKFANEKAVEVKKVAKTTKNEKVINVTLENYKKELKKIQRTLKNVKSDEKKEINEFLDKLVDSQIKHQKILLEIEKESQDQTLLKIQEVKKAISKTAIEVPLQFETPQDFGNRLSKVLEGQKGSELKYFKNLEMLESLGKQVPEVARDAIEHAQENSLKRLKKTLEKDKNSQEKFKDYVQETSGNIITHLQIIEKIENIGIKDEAKKIILEVKEKALERASEKLSEIKKENVRRMLLQELEDKTGKNIKIIEELEKNLSQKAVPEIIEIKKSMQENLKKESEEQKNEKIQQRPEEFPQPVTDEETEEFFESGQEEHSLPSENTQGQGLFGETETLFSEPSPNQ